METTQRYGTQHDEGLAEVAPGVYRLRTLMVNLFLVETPDSPNSAWVLVDAGLPGYKSRILRAAEERFGAYTQPGAIVLTHGHFDHIGAVQELADRWDVPVYAHPLEAPYLTGRSSYPPPDPSVGGGLMARLSFLYPKNPIDLGSSLKFLPDDGTIPEMPGWRWIHTPGHAPGHVSLFRDSDRTLIAGDAFVSVKQESFLSVLSQKPGVFRPPAYFTPDWEAARRSIERLAALAPEVAATGHGPSITGDALRDGLDRLIRNFVQQGVPSGGRYVDRPAIMDEKGIVYVPPRTGPNPGRIVTAVAFSFLAGTALYLLRKNRP